MRPTQLLYQLALGSALLAAAVSASASQPPQRVASTNLCTDTLLLDLLPPERIVSLSYWIGDPDQSVYHDRYPAVPLNRGLAEELLPLAPDLVLTGEFSGLGLKRLLDHLGIPVAVVPTPSSLAELPAHLHGLGELLGVPERAAELTRELAAQLDALRYRGADSERLLAAVYGPQGVTAGRGTLLDELLEWAGYRNLATQLGLSGYVILPLETLVRHPVDVLIFNNADRSPHSLANRLQQHPVLADPALAAHRRYLPSALTACIGPATVAALNWLVAERPQ